MLTLSATPEFAMKRQARTLFSWKWEGWNVRGIPDVIDNRTDEWKERHLYWGVREERGYFFPFTSPLCAQDSATAFSWHRISPLLSPWRMCPLASIWTNLAGHASSTVDTLLEQILLSPKYDHHHFPLLSSRVSLEIIPSWYQLWPQQGDYFDFNIMRGFLMFAV